MPLGRLPKAWKNLPLSKKRKQCGESWLQWGKGVKNDDEEEEQYEPNAIALAYNAPMVHAMFENFMSLDTPVLQTLVTLALRLTLIAFFLFNKSLYPSFINFNWKWFIQVTTFYESMDWTVSTSKIYNESWGLRKLFGYAHRREKDAFKRGQTPPDS